MHIAFVQYNYEPIESPQALLEMHFTTVEWAKALTDAGTCVTVIYRFNSDHHFVKDFVSYYFIKDNLPPDLKSFRLSFSYFNKVKKIVKERKVDIIHVNNLKAISANFLISRIIKDIPILVQDHGSVLKTNNFLNLNIVNLILRLSFKKIKGFVFAAKGQENAWVNKKILAPEKCFFVMENSSIFSYKERAISRTTTEVNGEPVFLWVGNLDENKDPMTALKAFLLVFAQIPAAKLYMIYRFDTIQNKVEKFINQNPLLKKNVTLLGAKKRNELSDYYNSADYIISASHKEGSGYSVIEAMSCGVIPVLSNIPSFSGLTHQGKIGAIFDVGNSYMMYEQILKLCSRPLDQEKEKVLSHFEEYFSFNALAKNALSIYNLILTQNRNGC